MTFNPANSLSYQIPQSIAFSNDFNVFLRQMKEFYELNSRATNSRDIGIYTTVEILNGQQIFTDDAQKYTQVFRKVIDFGALPNAGLKSVAHNIADIADNWRFTRIYADARDTSIANNPIFIAIPNSGDYQAQISIDKTNINIKTTVNLSNFTSTLVFLEYAKL
jgi:hypothetical protein